MNFMVTILAFVFRNVWDLWVVREAVLAADLIKARDSCSAREKLMLGRALGHADDKTATIVSSHVTTHRSTVFFVLASS